ncbi:MAG: AAA family ATPase [Deltaproteobacteria bacterium]|nr:AAA family ATPase [Deltaproteobacteria bacterium]
MIYRDISNKIIGYSKQYPVVTITGPRQSGKTTLCRMLFQDKPYISLVFHRELSLMRYKEYLIYCHIYKFWLMNRGSRVNSLSPAARALTFLTL